MTMTLQHIPPIQCLLTFEAVARLRHAGRAADELCVTPSAVSHRIRQLESHVGFKLFGRSDFSLTADGAAYLANVRTGLAALQATPLGSNAAQRATRLRIAVTPTFSRQFLMPRLELFRNIYPDIELVLQVSIPLLDVTAEQADLEVRYGPGGYADCEHRLILEEQVVPACSPSYLNEFGAVHGVSHRRRDRQRAAHPQPARTLGHLVRELRARPARAAHRLAVQRPGARVRRRGQRLRRGAGAAEDGRGLVRGRAARCVVRPGRALAASALHLLAARHARSLGMRGLRGLAGTEPALKKPCSEGGAGEVCSSRPQKSLNPHRARCA
jgi:DNA-binding transcriptional LysR family regulator